jgi:hypothetical protein
MATRKNNWLNAKPVTKAGGKSGGARNPAKPYNKPAATSGTPKVKTKTQKLQQAAKTKPSSPAPKQVIKKPVTRTGPVKGPVAPKGSTGPITLPNSRRAGVNLPQTGARAERTATRAIQPRDTVKPQTTSSRPLTAADGRPVKMDAKGWPKGTESWASNSTKAATKAAGLGGRMLGAFGTALAIPAAIKNIADVAERNRQWDAYKERMGMNKPTPTTKPSSTTAGRRTGTNNRTANLSVPTSPAGTRAGAAAGTRTRSRATTQPTAGKDWRSRVSNSDVNALRQGQNDAIRSYGNKPAAPKPAKPASTQSGGGSTQSRSGGGGSSRPVAPAPRRQPGPAADAGMKNQDKNFKGNVFEKTFGYKPGSAPDQVRDRTSNLSNKFGQDSGYQPKTKVDGSQYADKKPDMAKVKEYDRRKRRYYDS